MSTPPPRRKDPYDFPPLSPLNTDDLQRNFDDYEDLSWEDSFERSVVSHKAPGRRNGGLKKIKIVRPKSAPAININRSRNNISRVKGSAAPASTSSKCTPKTMQSSALLNHTTTTIPSISTVLISERRKKIEEETLLFSRKVQEDAEQMHQHLMRSIADINVLSISLGITAHYFIREEDVDLIRCGKECGQPFIHKTVRFDSTHPGYDGSSSSSSSVNATETRGRGNTPGKTHRGDRVLSMSLFLKEYNQLKIEASKVKSLQPSVQGLSSSSKNINTSENRMSGVDMAAFRGTKNSNNIGSNNLFNDTDSIDNSKSEQSSSDPDPVTQAYISGGRLLASLMDRGSSSSSAVDYSHQNQFQNEFNTSLDRHHQKHHTQQQHSQKNSTTLDQIIHPHKISGNGNPFNSNSHSNSQEFVSNRIKQKNIEEQQLRVLNETVALRKQVEQQIAEIMSRGWNIL